MPHAPGSRTYQMQLSKDCANPVIRLSVPADSSVWETIGHTFPGRGDDFILGAVNYLQLKIDEDPTLPVRNVNLVPVGYAFAMGGDGAGPNPIKQALKEHAPGGH